MQGRRWHWHVVVPPTRLSFSILRDVEVQTTTKTVVSAPRRGSMISFINVNIAVQLLKRKMLATPNTSPIVDVLPSAFLYQSANTWREHLVSDAKHRQ